MQSRQTAGPAAPPVPGHGSWDSYPLPALPGDGARATTWTVDGDDEARHLELAAELEGMAAMVGEVDPRSAARMEDLARAVASDEGRQRWSDVDLRRAFHTERLAHTVAVRREGGYASSAIAQADRVRNVLVLMPIFLTWFALFDASRAYATFIQKNPDEVRKPFLLLWQLGFGGEASPFSPTFSTVAIIDAMLIGLIIALTFYAHGRREARDEKIDLTADNFQADLDNLLAEASVLLASDRGSRPERLARSVERLAERFERNSQELLTRLRVEHERLEQVAGRREREFADFGVFASGMRAGAEETHRLLVDLRQVSTGLSQALEDLTSEVSITTDQQRTLLSAVQGLERLTTSGIQSDQAVTRQIGIAATTLADAADKSLAGAEAAAQAARVATEAVRGIAEIAQGLASSQTRVESAVTSEAEANTRLAEALRGSATGVSASTRALQEIGSALTQLRDELGRLSKQSAEQAATLSGLLGEQSVIANGLSQVARDLSSVSIVTAQRQQEVNKDVGSLVSRLDNLTGLLDRATRSAPTTDNLERAFTAALRGELGAQAEQIAEIIDARVSGTPATAAVRRDPGRLWPQRRT